MPTQINGLPAHILLVHAVIVLVPLAALLTVLSALWPAARHRLGFITPLMALVALVAVPITTEAGEWLERRVVSSPLIRHHTELGDQLLPWAIGVFVVALGQWVYFARAKKVTSTIAALVAVLAVAASVGAVVQVYRIGESGSKAVWTGSFSETPVG